MKISATIITYNEERNLPRAIESLRCADEIVVIDSGSNDRTVEIAEKLGARVVECPWPGYANQKNRAAEEAAYFMIREALTNAVKHAGASRIDVIVERSGDVATVRIRDNGAGGADPRRGTGLTGLRDRVQALGGTIDVQSPPGAGTRVQAELPISA